MGGHKTELFLTPAMRRVREARVSYKERLQRSIRDLCSTWFPATATQARPRKSIFIRAPKEYPISESTNKQGWRAPLFSPFPPIQPAGRAVDRVRDPPGASSEQSRSLGRRVRKVDDVGARRPLRRNGAKG
ncbi:hypothetical protein MRX96_054239 [Rhipicephalus microplus]